jgi:hypothetical protein
MPLKKKEKKKKEKFEDDGHVVADMDFEHITGYRSKKHRENRQAIKEANLSRKERWAIYKAAFTQYMPIFGIFFLSIVVVLLFLRFVWMA